MYCLFFFFFLETNTRRYFDWIFHQSVSHLVFFSVELKNIFCSLVVKWQPGLCWWQLMATFIKDPFVTCWCTQPHWNINFYYLWVTGGQRVLLYSNNNLCTVHLVKLFYDYNISWHASYLQLLEWIASLFYLTDYFLALHCRTINYIQKSKGICVTFC